MRIDYRARIDLHAVANQAGCGLADAFAALEALYAEVDARNARNTAELALPCRRGCSMCCHESVFVTALEFFYAWDWAQRHLADAAREAIVARGVQIYATHREAISALDDAAGAGAAHDAIARQLRFACPLLAADGACQVYPARELGARLFGASFNERRGVYGCYMVADHLAERVGERPITLLQARPTVRRVSELPLTEKRQVYPYWLHLLYVGA